MTVWILVISYGLNGAEVLGVFAHQPTEEECDALGRAAAKGVYTCGWDLVEAEVQP